MGECTLYNFVYWGKSNALHCTLFALSTIVCQGIELEIDKKAGSTEKKSSDRCTLIFSSLSSSSQFSKKIFQVPCPVSGSNMIEFERFNRK